MNLYPLNFRQSLSLLYLIIAPVARPPNRSLLLGAFKDILRLHLGHVNSTEPNSDPDPILASLNTVKCSNNRRTFSGPRKPYWVAPPFPLFRMPSCRFINCNGLSLDFPDQTPSIVNQQKPTIASSHSIGSHCLAITLLNLPTMFCGCGMAFGLRKKNRRDETTEGVSGDAPRMIDISPWTFDVKSQASILDAGLVLCFAPQTNYV